MSPSQPYIKIIPGTVSPDDPTFHAISGIMLESCPTGRLTESNYQASSLTAMAKQIDLINSLYQPKSSIAYAIRNISKPHLVANTGGVIETCVLCRLTAQSKEEASRKIEEQTAQLLIQLCASYPDHIWQLLQTPDELEQYLNPVDWRRTHFAEIRRREELVALDTIQPRRYIGFKNSQSSDRTGTNDRLYFIHPFLPHPGQLERLLRMLLLSPKKIILTITLAPVVLTSPEERGLLDAISISEGYRKDPSTNLQRIQEHRATMLCDAFMSQLLNLQDAPFYVTISMASVDKLPDTLMEAAGLAVSASIGEGLHPVYPEQAFIQMGGYDVVFPRTTEEKGITRNNLASLTQKPWGKTLAPKGIERLRYLMNGHEAVCAFRFPDDHGEGLPGIKTHTQRNRPIPPELAGKINKSDHKTTLLLGTNTYMGVKNDVRLPNQDRLMHMYVVGQTGTGKSTLLKTMVLSDIEAGRGCALIDPHGDLYDEVLGLIPPERVEDVVLLDPADTEFPIGMNLLEAKTLDERYFICREMQAIIRRLMEDDYGRYGLEMIGPVFFQHMQMNMLLTMSDPDHPGTLIEFFEIFQSEDFWKRWVPLKTDDQQLKLWVENVLSNNNYTRRAEGGHSTMGAYLSSKFTDFIFDPRLRCIFGQSRSTIDLHKIMNEEKILLVNLAKGMLGEANSRFFGLILMAKLQAEAMKRVNIPPTKRTPYFIYVDEFQSLATENFTILLSEARKFKLGLVLANQFISQIKDYRVIQALFGNVGSFLSFRLGRDDASMVEPHFYPHFDSMDLINMPNWQVAMRTTLDGKGMHPFTLNTILPRSAPNQKIADQVRSLSRSKYGKPRAEVERLIAESLQNKPPI